MTGFTQSLDDLLKATSRSFYLTLRVLPAKVRPQIGLAYLLARTTDTIADTEVLPLDERLGALARLRQRIVTEDIGQSGEKLPPLDFAEFSRQQGSDAEKLLLARVNDSLAILRRFSPDDQKLIRDVLSIITSGQELDLRRFGGASADNIVPLETDFDLDDYTYRVAGCVGEFWTKMCRAHLFPQAALDERQFLVDGVRFGKGLQLVNILRDLPADLKKGRCYLPMKRLRPAGLAPETLLSSASQDKFLPLYRDYLSRAESHLLAGWNYTNTLPIEQFRVRLACAWPVLIGAKTIEKLRIASVNELQQHVKVRRSEVRGIIACSVLEYPFPSLWRKLFAPMTRAVTPDGNLA
jgi:farnesyl-diphosphate farnesyltransferase